jgi:hypothetical protein
MGPSWVAVRDAAHAGTLRAADAEARAVCKRWEQFMEYLALGLSQDLGRDVSVVRSRRQAADQRLQTVVRVLADDGALTGSVRVPDAVAPLDLRADLRTRRVIASMTVEAPGEGRPLSRINWLLRQIADAPADLRVDVAFQNTRETTSLLLADAREDPSALLSPTDPKRVPRSLTVAAARALGTKRGKGRGPFVADTRAQAIDFYGQIVQSISAWRAKPRACPGRQSIQILRPAPSRRLSQHQPLAMSETPMSRQRRSRSEQRYVRATFSAPGLTPAPTNAHTTTPRRNPRKERGGLRLSVGSAAPLC